jgi:hypothetical protein
MKRLLVFLVLTVIATAVAAAPAYAGGPFVAPHGAVILHQAGAGVTVTQAGISFASATRDGHVPRAGTLGRTVAQTAGAQVTRIFGRGILVPRGAQGGVGAGIVAALVFIGGAVYAIVAGGRRPKLAASAAKPVCVGGHKATRQERKAA